MYTAMSAHQLETRRYMDFLRMEGEFNFLVFMPEGKRVELRDFWYREASPDVKEYVLGRKAFIYDDSRIEYHTDDPKKEFFSQLEGRLPRASAHRYQPLDDRFAQMQRLTGKSFSLMPEVAFVHVIGGAGGDSVYTIIHNSAYLNNTQLFREEARRLPVEDYLTVVKGFIGSYPNIFFQLPEQRNRQFCRACRIDAGRAGLRQSRHRLRRATDLPGFLAAQRYTARTLPADRAEFRRPVRPQPLREPLAAQ